MYEGSGHVAWPNGHTRTASGEIKQQSKMSQYNNIFRKHKQFSCNVYYQPKSLPEV